MSEVNIAEDRKRKSDSPPASCNENKIRKQEEDITVPEATVITKTKGFLTFNCFISFLKIFFIN